MNWVDSYDNQQQHKRTFLESLRNLTLQDNMSNCSEQNIGKPQSGGNQMIKFISNLHNEFKSYNYVLSHCIGDQFEAQGFDDFKKDGCLRISQNIKKHQDKNKMNFSININIILPSKYENLDLSIKVEINAGLSILKMQSFPLINNQFVTFEGIQICTINRYLSALNHRIEYGTFSVNPETGILSLIFYNQFSIMKMKEFIDTSYPLIEIIKHQLEDVKIWNVSMPKIISACSLKYYLIKRHQRKQHANYDKSTNFDKGTNYDKSTNYDKGTSNENHNHANSDKYSTNTSHQPSDVSHENNHTAQINVLCEYVKQSHIEHKFMLDKIKSKEMNEVEINRKIAEISRLTTMKNYNRHNLIKDLQRVVQNNISEEQTRLIESKGNVVLDEKKIEEMTKNISMKRLESKNEIYSNLYIHTVLKQHALFRSRLSQLKVLQISGQKVQDQSLTMNLIVSKCTPQLSRHRNQCQVLNIIGSGKSLFITRYYHSKQQEDKILLEYCPQKSIDSYLISHRKFISIDTKIFFLYQITIGLRFLRDYAIVHNDLKPQNILLKIIGDKLKINSTFLARLIDFGQSYSPLIRIENERNRYKKGYTMPYASPEQIKSEKFSQKSDVFSFGVMLYQIIFDNFPIQILRKGRECYLTEEYLNFYSMAPQKCEYYCLPKIMQLLFLLCLKCLNPNPLIRPALDWLCLIFKELLNFLQKQYQ